MQAFETLSQSVNIQMDYTRSSLPKLDYHNNLLQVNNIDKVCKMINFKILYSFYFVIDVFN